MQYKSVLILTDTCFWSLSFFDKCTGEFPKFTFFQKKRICYSTTKIFLLLYYSFSNQSEIGKWFQMFQFTELSHNFMNTEVLPAFLPSLAVSCSVCKSCLKTAIHHVFALKCSWLLISVLSTYSFLVFNDMQTTHIHFNAPPTKTIESEQYNKMLYAKNREGENFNQICLFFRL